jgi:DNA-binding transcriptional LysR family regulator
LNVFVTVADEHSFLRASQALFVSRQAVGKTIDQLEEELGIKLFVRGQNGVQLTPAGKYFYTRAKALVSDLNDLRSEMGSMWQGQVSIKACFSEALWGFYSRGIKDYAAKNSAEVKIETVVVPEPECEHMLPGLGADVVISFAPQSASSITTSLALESPMVFLVSKEDPLADEGVLRLSWSKRVGRFLLFTGGTDHGLWWPTIPRQGDECCASLESLFETLKREGGILPIPEFLVPQTMGEFRILRPSKSVTPCRVYCSLLRKHYHDPGKYDQLLKFCDEAVIIEEA